VVGFVRLARSRRRRPRDHATPWDPAPPPGARLDRPQPRRGRRGPRDARLPRRQRPESAVPSGICNLLVKYGDRSFGDHPAGQLRGWGLGRGGVPGYLGSVYEPPVEPPACPPPERSIPPHTPPTTPPRVQDPSQARRPRCRAIGWALALASTAVVLVLTLTPAGTDQWVSSRISCIICGSFGTANLLRNVLLFVPLGVGLGLAIRRPLPAWLITVALTTLIELLQFDIPGRNPLLIDWVANAGGGALGIVFARALLRSLRAGQAAHAPGETHARDKASLAGPRHTPPPGRRATLVWCTLVLAVLVSSAAAFRLAWPPDPWFMQWTPRLAHFDTYEGRIASAHVGPRALPPGRSGETALIREALVRGDTLRVEVIAAPAPRRLAPVFSIYNADQDEVLVLGVSGPDLVLRLPYLAAPLALERPDHRIRGALADVAPGERFTIDFIMSDEGPCFGLRGAVRCDLQPDPAVGWALLRFPGEASPGILRLLGLVWLLGLSVPAGLLSPDRRWALGVGVTLGGGLLAASIVPGTLAVASVPGALTLAAGVGIGFLARTTMGALLLGRRPATYVAAPQHGGSGRPAREGR
jgi:hypothetical protein